MGNIFAGAVEVYVTHGRAFKGAIEGYTVRVTPSGGILVKTPMGWFTAHHDLTRKQLQYARRQADRIRAERLAADLSFQAKLIALSRG